MMDRRILWEDVWAFLVKDVRDEDRRQECGAHAWILIQRCPEASPQLIAWRAIRRVSSGRPIPGSGMGSGAGHYRAKERVLLQAGMDEYPDWRTTAARLALLRLTIAEVLEMTSDSGRQLLRRMLDGESMTQAARSLAIPHAQARRIIRGIRRRYSKTAK